MWQLLLRAQPHSVRLRVMLATRSTLGSTFARIILFWVEESICDFVIVVTRRLTENRPEFRSRVKTRYRYYNSLE